MRFKLVIFEDAATGKGTIQIIEDKSPSQQPIAGFISFDDAAKKEFYVKALTQNGKHGEVISASAASSH